MTSRVFDVHEPSQVSTPRREAAALATALGFSETRAGQVALVVSELASNLVKHAREGQLLLRSLHGPWRPHGTHPYASAAREMQSRSRAAAANADAANGIEILAIDRGPGMRDLVAARRDGYSTSGTLGSGLGAVERQSDEFDIFSQPSLGTIAVARVWHRPTEPSGMGARIPSHTGSLTLGAVSVAIKGESLCGDAWAAHLDTDSPTILVVDGLGHGLAAAEAASLAVDTFDRVQPRNATVARRSPEYAGEPDAFERPPSALVNDLHSALRPTRGAAVAAVQIDPLRSIARFAGVGNITGATIAPDLKRHAMTSHNGTAGHVLPRVQEFTYPITSHTTLVLHSDGLTSKWNPADYPDLWSHDPALIAGVLYRDFARGRDDVTVVVARWTRE